jgi:hypothetical protein
LRDWGNTNNVEKTIYGGTAPSVSNILASGTKILLGFLILGERKRIVDFIDRKNNEEVEENY